MPDRVNFINQLAMGVVNKSLVLWHIKYGKKFVLYFNIIHLHSRVHQEKGIPKTKVVHMVKAVKKIIRYNTKLLMQTTAATCRYVARWYRRIEQFSGLKKDCLKILIWEGACNSDSSKHSDRKHKSDNPQMDRAIIAIVSKKVHF